MDHRRMWMSGRTDGLECTMAGWMATMRLKIDFFFGVNVTIFRPEVYHLEDFFPVTLAFCVHIWLRMVVFTRQPQ